MAVRIRVPKEVIHILLADGKIPRETGLDIFPFINNMEIIKNHITNGISIPEHFYRDTTGIDYLYKEQGWMHLHVGYGIDDDVLLLVQETDNKVIIIGFFTHKIFNERPRGKSAFGLKRKIAKAKL